ncbi:S8 family peptidase [Bacterioplanoides pacificum]|uniref:S8 family serine peptidase n=1 Tax=Bacterioplanoides pacificum TaxID=1171596 RepID=A0ABV7VPQ5_9GAMM
MIKTFPAISILLILLTVQARAESFLNFGKTIKLSVDKTTLSSAQHLYRTTNAVTLATANRILVRLEKNKTALLLNHLDNVKSSEILADFPEFSIHLLYLHKNNALNFARELMKHPDVVYAQPDFLQVTQGKFRFSDHPSAAPHSSSSSADVWQNWKQAIHFSDTTTQGSGVKVAVIDDAFDLSHPAFKNIQLTFRMNSDSRTENVSPKADHEKHGTMVAGLLWANWPEKKLHGLIPDAEMIAIANQYNWTSAVVLSLYLAYIAGADVINCSWGMPMLMQPIADTVKAIRRHGRNGKGSAIVFAAGNQRKPVDSADTLQSMAEVTSVAAIDPQYRVISNYGKTVDIAAPGLLATTDPRNHNKVSYIGGSSSAAPVISATIAMIYSLSPQLTISQVEQLLQKISHPSPLKNHDFGLVNVKLAVNCAALWNSKNSREVFPGTCFSSKGY